MGDQQYTVDDVLDAIADAPDGGLAHWRALVDQIFFDAAYDDAAGDMQNAAELLAIAQRAIARAKAEIRIGRAHRQRT